MLWGMKLPSFVDWLYESVKMYGDFIDNCHLWLSHWEYNPLRNKNILLGNLLKNNNNNKKSPVLEQGRNRSLQVGRSPGTGLGTPGVKVCGCREAHNDGVN